jgi:hypothetical protein
VPATMLMVAAGEPLISMVAELVQRRAKSAREAPGKFSSLWAVSVDMVLK